MLHRRTKQNDICENRVEIKIAQTESARPPLVASSESRLTSFDSQASDSRTPLHQPTDTWDSSKSCAHPDQLSAPPVFLPTSNPKPRERCDQDHLRSIIVHPLNPDHASLILKLDVRILTHEPVRRIRQCPCASRRQRPHARSVEL